MEENCFLIKKRKLDKSTHIQNRKEILEGIYLNLLTKRNSCSSDWPFLLNCVISKDEEIRWLSSQIVAHLSKMSYCQRKKFVLQHCSKEIDIKLSIKYLENSNDLGKAILPEIDKYSSNDTFMVGSVPLTVLKVMPKNTSLVELPSTMRNLETIAMSIKLNSPVLIEGIVGSGKTCLVNYLAEVTGRKDAPRLTKVQLGGQTDCKSLIGTYRCTKNPGEFVWQAGSITKCVMEGHWLMLEDINMAPMEVISHLLPLVELRSLPVPGYGTIKAHENFHIFATMRKLDAERETVLGPVASIENFFKKVCLLPLATDELKTLILFRFSTIPAKVVDKVIEIYLVMSSGRHSSNDLKNDCIYCQSVHLSLTRASGRLISVRDLMKLCKRIAVYANDDDFNIRLYHESFDCFCSAIADDEKRQKSAYHIASHLGVGEQLAKFYYLNYKPEISIQNKQFVVGNRAKIRINVDVIPLSRSTKEFVFSETRLSCCLLERITIATLHKEPVLLVGETGTGKTSTVQYLARKTGNRLNVLNMNQQSDSSDLLGGFKPVDLSTVLDGVKATFEKLFAKTFKSDENVQFLLTLVSQHRQKKWSVLVALMKKPAECAVHGKGNKAYVKEWQKFLIDLDQCEKQIMKSAVAFSYIEGTLVKAVIKGEWVLMDEVNLASPETLECLSGLLESEYGSITLHERGDHKPIKRHPNFQLFACMNPATDVGKKELPAGLRNRFTEFYMDEFTDVADLMQLVEDYLRNLNLSIDKIKKIVDFYFDVRRSSAFSLADGTNSKPHFSLRTLCRALAVAKRNPLMVIQRSLYEAFCLSFLTQLDRKSHNIMRSHIEKCLIGHDGNNKQCTLNLQMDIPCPGKTIDYVEVCKYWIPRGKNVPNEQPKYILTKTVKQNLLDLVRIVSIGRYPVLLQGDTSVGKTSLITYLAELTGNTCVRINNHQHTDIQEYVGCYGPDETGKLVFKKGALVNAMERGHWVILDELNLAPSDVLEALNRLLDDNKELFIPEIGQSIKAHPHFILFATQNPPRQYGGRQILSRAFRNRFVELHFDLIPTEELQQILHLRCDIPTSYCEKMVAVHEELQRRRRETNLFEGKQSFITLRDLFRWAERYRLAPKQTTKFYDWRQHLADEGYLILGGRVRNDNEEAAVKKVLETKLLNEKLKCTNQCDCRARAIKVENLFTLNENTSPVTRSCLEQLAIIEGFEHIVWTYDMRRLFVLVSKSLSFCEPVLLVGETGCGKTSVCQMIAALAQKQLRTVNCHMHSEGADFLGGIRPTRDRQLGQQRMFEWVDGPLVLSMKEGGMFLADEISLADDSVLERLNSVLEPERTLILTEKGTENDSSQLLNSEMIVADEGFRFVGTMNPGGDFGKKELSTALRNRFTEIWCPKIDITKDTADVVAIVEHNIAEGIILNDSNGDSGIGKAMLSFLQRFVETAVGKKCTFSIRDLLSWIGFINKVTKEAHLPIEVAYVHGACLVILDGLGSGATGSSVTDWRKGKDASLKYLCWQASSAKKRQLSPSTFLDENVDSLINTADQFGVGPFVIDKRTMMAEDLSFAFTAPRTSVNLMRLLRGLQLSRPVLLEGSPGVGKTSLVMALAKQTGHDIIRINLSEQTDVSDLFGADFPVEDEEIPRFAWRDGPLLQALKSGSWVVFDELNLASQPVLEGLNACFDHRGEIFVPELNRTFKVEHQQTKIFACQNPQYEGGARKGLPKSFLNRFTQVFLEPFSSRDLYFILSSLYKNVPEKILKKMVQFNDAIIRDMQEAKWGRAGGPWEFNLRDMFRWCDIMERNQCGSYNPGEFVSLIYADRLRKQEDKSRLQDLYGPIFGTEYPLYEKSGKFTVSAEQVQFGRAVISRSSDCVQDDDVTNKNLYIMNNQTPILESLVNCVNMNWMTILVGASGEGKTTLVQLLAKLCGKSLQTFPVNSEMDVTELLGGFEQGDKSRHLQDIKEKVELILLQSVRTLLLADKILEAGSLLYLWDSFSKSQEQKHKKMETEPVKMLTKQCILLKNVIFALQKASIGQQMEDLERRCTRLKAHVEKTGKITGGGTFEWVDSILVKAVTNGDWVLIDGVNLCSPSVLDRLNGLLEPGGVLTLNEKGTVNGVIPTLIPHPNFRLFLAMDPKHGELSRAMRNRGIELCLTRPWHNSLDMQSLMQSGKLTDIKIQNVLYQAHRLISDSLPGYEKPKINAFIQASQQIAHQVEMGVNSEDAVKTALDECYINTSISASGKQTIRELVTSQLNYSIMKEPASYDSVNILLPVSDLTRDYDVIFANQIHSLISFLYSVGEDEAKRCLNAPLSLPIPIRVYSRLEAVLPTVLTLLAAASYSQWTILHQLCNQRMSPCNTMLSFVTGKIMEIFKDETVDYRFFGNSLNSNNLQDKNSTANKNLIGLWTAPNCSSNWLCKQRRSPLNSIGKMSVKELSRSLSTKTVLNPFKIPIGIKHIDDTFRDFENFLTNLPFGNDFDCSDSLYFKVVSGSRWIDHLKGLCGKVVPINQLDDFLPQISFYWKMINDNFLSVIPPEWLSIAPPSLKNNILKMDVSFKRKGGPASELVDSLLKTKECLSFYSELHYDGYMRLYEIVKRTAPKLGFPLVNAHIAASGKQMKTDILNLVSTILVHNSACYERLSNSDSLPDLEDDTNQMVDHWSSEMTKFEKTLQDVSSSFVTDHYNGHIQMWPLFDYFACKCLEDGSDNSKKAFQMASYIPANIMWVMNNGNRLSYSFLYLFRISSCATTNVMEWMQYTDDSTREYFESKSDVIFSDVCSLIYLFITGNFSSGKELEKITVGSHFDQKMELKQFQSIIYNNWNHMRIPENSSVYCYSRTVNNCTAEFLNMLLNSTTSDMQTGKLTVSLVENAFLTLQNTFERSSFKEKNAVNVLFDRMLEAVRVLENGRDIAKSAKLGILSGLLQSWILSHLDLLDPMLRREFLLGYYSAEEDDFQQILEALKWQEILRCGQENCDSHPHKNHIEVRLPFLQKEIHRLRKETSYRKESSYYIRMVTRISEFTSDIFSPISVIEIMNRIETSGKSGIQEAINALHSWDNFVMEMITSYPVYRDFLIPILNGICLASEGFRILISSAQRTQVHQQLHLSSDVDRFISEMVAFPVHRHSNTIDELIRMKDLQKVIKNATLNGIERESIRVNCLSIRSVMYDLYNCIVSEKRVAFSSFKMFDNLVQKIYNIWQQEEEKRREKEMKEESLYIHIKTETEDEEIEREFKELFPDHRSEFDDDPEQEVMEEENLDDLKQNSFTFEEEHLQELILMHKSIMFLSVPNAQPFTAAKKPIFDLYPCTSHLFRLKQMQTLFSHLGPFGSESCDAEALSGILMSNHVCLSVLEGGIDLDICKRPFNFYKDAAPNEAVKVVSILKKLNVQTNSLLRKWEGHPALIRTSNVIKRVLNLSVTSPMIRMVTGLEAVLTVSQEWQRVAHKRVVLDLDEISDQIEKWRKLELANWNTCLDMMTHEVTCMTAKWWWHLYATLVDSIKTYNPRDLSDLIKNLKTFMESSPVGQYNERLQFLSSFHLHLCIIEQTDGYLCDRRAVRQMTSLTWNIYRYYCQFSSANEKKLDASRKPIEKNIKEFVKISRWNDKNFFSIQESVNKSHRTLHNEMRKWKKSLLQQVALSDVNLVSEDRSHHKPLDSIDFDKLTKEEIIIRKSRHSSKLVSYIPKCSKFLAKMVNNSVYQELNGTFDELSGDVITSFQESTDAMTEASNIKDQERKVKRVKEVIHRKRTLLSNMFKTFKSMGVSYTKGNNQWKENDLDKCLVAAPIKSSSFDQSHFRLNFDKSCDKFDHYFFRNIARLSLLNGILEKPHTDLGPELIKIMKGSSHFSLLLIRNLRSKIPINSLSQFRFLIKELEKATGGLFLSSFTDKWLLLSSHLSALLLSLKETKVVLSGYVCDEPLVKFEQNCSFTMESMTDCNSRLQLIEEKVITLINELSAQFIYKYQRDLVLSHQENVNKLVDLYEEASSVSRGIIEINSIINTTESSYSLLHQLTTWSESFEKEYTAFTHWRTSISLIKIEENATFFDREIFKKLFFRVQNLYKLHCEREKEDEESVSLISQLSRQGEDICLLGVPTMTMILTSVVSNLQQNGSSESLLELQCYLPILKSYLVFCDNLILSYINNLTAFSKLQSVIVGVYLQLGQKGYCRPVDVEFDGEGDGIFSFEESGPGLADGEGTKDVSDKLESEDQVESALQKDEKEKSADDECEEEETGVELNQDFDGKLQDLNQNEEEETKSDDEEQEELDKQMDQTEEGSDKLDEKIWEDEDEEEIDEDEKRTDTGDSKETQENINENIGMDEEPEQNDDKKGEEYAEGSDDKPETDPNEMVDKENETEQKDLPDNAEEEDENAKVDSEPTAEDNEQATEDNDKATDDKDQAPDDKDQAPDDNEEDTKDDNEEGQVDDANDENVNNDDLEDGLSDDEATQVLEGEDEPSDDVNAPPEAFKDDKFDGDEAIDDICTNGGTGTNENQSKELHDLPEEAMDETEQERVELADDNTGSGQSKNTDTSRDGEALSLTSQSNNAAESLANTKPGKTDEKRTIGHLQSELNRNLKTKKATEVNDESNEEKKDSSLYEHLADANQHWDKQTTDAATEEQVNQMPPPLDQEEQMKGMSDNTENEKEIEESEPTRKRKAEDALTEGKDGKKLKSDRNELHEENEEDADLSSDAFGTDDQSGTAFYTLIANEDEAARLFFDESVHTREQMEVLDSGDMEMGVQEWNQVDQKVTPYALELCEQLRLVLEPTQASKLKGDFRTGKRLNMRKIIPYIASDFRKDKIWLRRIMPNKRTYQILIAIDDSESMANVKASHLAKEGLAMVAKALNYLEAGSVGILSFGLRTKILHHINQPFSDQAGAKVFSNLNFNQNESNFDEMLSDAAAILKEARGGSGAKPNIEQLLIILSDGQTHAKSESVRRAVRAVRDQRVFVVFMVLDPEEENKYSFHSVLVWDDKACKAVSIMDVFPFPFFLVVRNLANLPAVLSTALRQWFELIS